MTQHHRTAAARLSWLGLACGAAAAQQLKLDFGHAGQTLTALARVPMMLNALLALAALNLAAVVALWVRALRQPLPVAAPPPAPPPPPPPPLPPPVPSGVAADQVRRAVAELQALTGDDAPLPATPAGLAERLLALVEVLRQRAAASAAAPEPPPTEEPAAEVEPEMTATDLVLELLARSGLPGSSNAWRETLKFAGDVPNRVLQAIEAGQGATVVRSLAVELDRALYDRLDPAQLTADVPDLDSAAVTGIVEWLRRQQSDWLARLAAAGLKRIATSVGSPFEPGRVVPDPDEPPRVTDRRELDGRVAGVKPGRGGYELHGQLICPTRAERYGWRSEVDRGPQ